LKVWKGRLIYKKTTRKPMINGKLEAILSRSRLLMKKVEDVVRLAYYAIHVHLDNPWGLKQQYQSDTMDSNNTENTWGGASPKFTRRQYFYFLTHEQTWQGWLGETPYKHSSYSLKMSSLLFSWSSFVDFVSFSLWRCKAERHRVCVAPCQPVTSNIFVIY